MCKQDNSGWVKVKFAHDCSLCECCEEPWCDEHEDHYADCDCVGPTQGGYEFKEIDGVVYAREL